jgi:hypothetical protein
LEAKILDLTQDLQKGPQTRLAECHPNAVLQFGAPTSAESYTIQKQPLVVSEECCHIQHNGVPRSLIASDSHATQ